MAVKILVGPRQDDSILDIARSLTPPGFELVVADVGTPQFYEAAAEAEYYLGFARQMGGEFFRAMPKLRLVQLTSAGYDRVDIEAARKAAVPVATNGGANAIAVSEHTILLMLAVYKRLVRYHNDVVAGEGGPPQPARGGGFQAPRQTPGGLGAGDIRHKEAPPAAGLLTIGPNYDNPRPTPGPGGA